MQLRKTMFAGSWYPEDASDCEAEIHRFIDSQESTPEFATLSGQPWIAGIVPHAGWYYSGRIACRVIQRLRRKSPVDLVVLFGMHLPAGAPNYIMPDGAWETPFGPLPVAETLAAELMRRFPFQVETPARHMRDNTIELQLPFVKYLLDPAQILAIGVPPAADSLEIGRAVSDWAQANNHSMVLIGSTDLTHYGPNYGFSPKGSGKHALAWVRDQNDRLIIEAMLRMDPDSVLREAPRRQNVCCAGAVATTIAAALRMGATEARTVAYSTSHDRSPGDSFVGYAGVLFG